MQEAHMKNFREHASHREVLQRRADDFLKAG